MKWLTLAGILLYLTRHADAGALRCSPNSQDPSCASGKRALILPQKEPSPEVECLAGSEWESNCHNCRCSESGFAQCVKQDSCDLKVLKEPIKCKPQTTFKRECNFCTCLDNGLGLCTLMGCVDFPLPQKTYQKISVSKRETTNSDKPNIQGENHVIVKRGVCKPNQDFQIDCNPCKCAANGQSYACTHNECLEGDNMNKEVEVFMESEGSDHIERHSVCKPRDTFYISCNPCHCNAYGTDYSCTNKPCPLPKDVEIFHELNEHSRKSSNSTKRVVCVANRMFIMDCNTCWCNEDGTSFFCTRRVCTPDSTDDNITEDPQFSEVKLKVIQKECRPNEVFELDCNTCRCNADGSSFSCTRRACVDTEKNSTAIRKTRATQSEAPKACLPGIEFRMDCNKCLCNDEGRDFSCTRIDCSAQNGNGDVDSSRSKREASEPMELKCVPGSVFDRECNPCRCTIDGLHAVCSIKQCKKDKPEPSTEPTQSFRCNPGDQFKRDCNDCTCSADGKTVFCALTLCDPPGL